MTAMTDSAADTGFWLLRESGERLFSPLSATEFTGIESLEHCLQKEWQGTATRADIAAFRSLGNQLALAVLPAEIQQALRTERRAALLIQDPDSRLPLEFSHFDEEFLGLRVPVGRSWNHAAAVSRKATGLHGVILGDPEFNLLHAHYEATDVRRLWEQSAAFDGITVLTSHVTREQALAALTQADWLHLCGHARVVNQHRGWAFRDGVLHPADLLAAGITQGPQFVFAHACGSAERSDPQVMTLKEVFRMLGCEHFLGTTVPIPDESTAPLVKQVYQNLFAGNSIGEAVLAGRRALASSGDAPSLLWACYTLYGDPTTSLVEPRAAHARLASVTRASVSSHVSSSTLSEPAPSRWTCHLCGKSIFTRHGLGGDGDLEEHAPAVCRACARHQQSLNRSPAVVAPEKQSPQPPGRQRPVVTTIQQESVSSVGGPVHAPSWPLAFRTRWQHTLNRFRRYLDFNTGREFSVRLIAEESTHSGSTDLRYRLQPDEANVQTADWPEIVVTNIQAAAHSMSAFLERLESIVLRSTPPSVICLAAEEEWLPEIEEYALGHGPTSFFHPQISLVLLDIESMSFRWRRQDLRSSAIAALFDLETNDEKMRRTITAIGEILPLETSLSAVSLAQELELPTEVVIPAMQQAARNFGLHLDDVPGFGWVLS